MNEHSIDHADFVVEHRYAATPSRLFAAWADPVAKASWFAPSPATHTLDFRVGGEEVVASVLPDGREVTFTSVYQDIIPEQRIVFSSLLATDGLLSTVSLTSIEILEDVAGSRLVLTEHDSFLDGQEKLEWREQGTRDWLDALMRSLSDPEVGETAPSGGAV